MTQTVKKKILLVDRYPAVRRGLRQMLEDSLWAEVCGEASEPEEAIRQLKPALPDLVLTEISFDAVGRGLDFIRRLRAHRKELMILIFSAQSETLFAHRAVEAGANGYLSKEEDEATILQAIQKVLSGKIHVSDLVANQMLHNIHTSKMSGNALPTECLTDRELAVFELLGAGLSRREIAEKLHLSIKTVDTYCEHIKHKLDLSDGTALNHRAVLWWGSKSGITEPDPLNEERAVAPGPE